MSEEKSQNEIDREEWEDMSNWRMGVFYISQRDSRMWVPKRTLLGRPRSGGTFNLAKPAARRFMITFALAIVGLLVLGTLFQRGG